ncbi:MAG: DUF7305 domain-containing protein [Acidimicrobiales bacterium]
MLRPGPRPGRATDERGSLVVAMAVIMVVAVLSTALVGLTINNLVAVRHTQDFSGALANADAGLSDAAFRIDQGASGSFCVGTPSGCVAPSVPGAPGVAYKATLDPASAPSVANSWTAASWTVQSLGVSGPKQVPHAIQATVSRSVAYPFAAFGNQGLTFNGNSGCNPGSSGIATYNSATPGAPPTCGKVYIGSNGTIVCHGGMSSNVNVVYFSGGGGVSGCSNTTADPTLYSLPIKSAPTSPTPQACPGSGTITGDLAPGVYLCTVPVTMSGNVVISPAGEVDLYIDLPAASNTSSTGALVIPAGSTVNCPSCGASPPTYPVAKDLQIFTNSIGNVGDSNGGGFTFGGVIYAPQANLTANGCKSVFYGALILNTLTCNGGPHLSVNYDEMLAAVTNPSAISNYSEIPSSSVTIGP